MVLFQHRDVCERNWLYVPEGTSPSFEGLYQPLPRDEALEILSRARQAVHDLSKGGSK